MKKVLIGLAVGAAVWCVWRAVPLRRRFDRGA